MTSSEDTEEGRGFDRRVMRVAVRLSLLALLVFWCLKILGPFINPILGGVVIAIAVQTPYAKLTRALGGRPRLAAALLVAIALLVLIVPALTLGASLVDSTAGLSDDFMHDEIKVPPPPQNIAEWPLIGDRLHALWLGASQNLESALVKLAPHLKDIGVWMASTIGNLGLGLLMFRRDDLHCRRAAPERRACHNVGAQSRVPHRGQAGTGDGGARRIERTKCDARRSRRRADPVASRRPWDDGRRGPRRRAMDIVDLDPRCDAAPFDHHLDSGDFLCVLDELDPRSRHVRHLGIIGRAQ